MNFFKKVGREVISAHEKYVTRWARPAVATGLSVFYGPAVGAAFTAATHPLHQFAAGVTMRSQGMQGLEARQKARAQAQRTTIYSAAGVGAGTLAAGAIGGWGALGAGLHGSSILGLGSGTGLLGMSNPLMAGAANASTTSGIVTEAGLLASLGGTAAKNSSPFITSYDQDPEKGKAGSDKNYYDELGKILGGAIGGMGGSGGGDQGGSGSGWPSGQPGGGGRVSDANGNADGSGSLMPLLVIGGALIFASAA